MILSNLRMIPEHDLTPEYWQGILDNGIVVVGETREECIVNAAELFPDLEVQR